jgi:hypothetical protein
MGVQLGFYGGSTRRQGHLGWFAGAAAAVRELPGSSGRLSPCLPDDGAQRCGCRRAVLACSSIPADRDHRFRRSDARTGHAVRAAPPLFACGLPTRAALVVLAWAGDGSPIRGCTTTTGDQVPSDTLNPHERPFTGMLDFHPRSASGRSGCSVGFFWLGGPPLPGSGVGVSGLCLWLRTARRDRQRAGSGRPDRR